MATKRTVVVFAEPTWKMKRADLVRRIGAEFTFDIAANKAGEVDLLDADTRIKETLDQWDGDRIDRLFRKLDGRLYGVVEPAGPLQAPIYFEVSVEFELSVCTWETRNGAPEYE